MSAFLRYCSTYLYASLSVTKEVRVQVHDLLFQRLPFASMRMCNGYTIVSLDKDWQTVSLVYWMVLKWR